MSSHDDIERLAFVRWKLVIPSDLTGITLRIETSATGERFLPLREFDAIDFHPEHEKEEE